MNKIELIKKIIMKKEFSQLPEKDVVLAFEKFNMEKYSDEEKVKLTRNLLRKVFSSFTSRKILFSKTKTSKIFSSSTKNIGLNKDEKWFLRKHLSTRERLPYYEKIYSRIFKGMGKNLSVIDLGAGINGFSYDYMNFGFKKIDFNVNYIAIEAMGQFVTLMNLYFENKKKENSGQAKAIHLSLFEIQELKKIIKKMKKPRIVFLLKTVDSIEMLKRDYSKKLISEISPLSDKFVISFSTRSMIKRKKFKVKRNWIINFIKENFEILDNFEFGGENYFVFKNKKSQKPL